MKSVFTYSPKIASMLTLLFSCLFLSLNSIADEFSYPPLKHEFTEQIGSTSNEIILRNLTIYGTTDNEAMVGLIKDFQNLYPFAKIRYFELQSQELFQRIRREKDTNTKSADIAISSAMDLQIKLANDGYARKIDISIPSDIPSWAVWRNEAFGTTLEPAVIIYNKPYFENRPLPKNRSDLIAFLESRPPDLYGKLATYNIAKSGLGYMFFSRDDSQYSGTWDLIRAMSDNGVKLYSQSSKIIDGVSSGELKLGYNVLGTYAISQLNDNPNLGIILPEDYTIVFSRLAIIPKAASSRVAGRLFLEYLLSERGQIQIANKAQLNPIKASVKSPHPLLRSLHDQTSSLRPIKVSPGLLVYLDQQKRKKILKRWRKTLQLP
ncbi:MAG: ABC transporter substrate-binding protein [Sneathiella sp.]